MDKFIDVVRVYDKVLKLRLIVQNSIATIISVYTHKQAYRTIRMTTFMISFYRLSQRRVTMTSTLLEIFMGMSDCSLVTSMMDMGVMELVPETKKELDYWNCVMQATY